MPRAGLVKAHLYSRSSSNLQFQRRRAQNRAAQRAFRERKEKHARDLEVQLSELTVKYRSLETSHSELSAAYEKLQKTLELLTNNGEADGGTGSTETLRKFLAILHGEIKIKAEREGKRE
jgi:AP-1-like factor